MGWNNYIVLPNLKLAFEVSRYISDSAGHFGNNIKEDFKGYDKILERFSENYDESIFETKHQDINVKQLSKLIKTYEDMEHLSNDNIQETMMYGCLKRYDKDLYIISNFKISL